MLRLSETAKAKLGYRLSIGGMLVTMPAYVAGFGSDRFWLAFNLLLSFLAVIQEASTKKKVVEKGNGD